MTQYVVNLTPHIVDIAALKLRMAPAVPFPHDGFFTKDNESVIRTSITPVADFLASGVGFPGILTSDDGPIDMVAVLAACRKFHPGMADALYQWRCDFSTMPGADIGCVA